MNLNELAATVHKANAKWWQDINTGQPIKRNKGELLALVHSEISEGFEAEIHCSMDDKLNTRLGGEVEAADAVIRLLDYAAGFGHDIGDRTEFSPDSLTMLAMDGKISWTALIHLRISRILELERKNKPGVGDEIAWLINFIAFYCKFMNYDLAGAITEKMAYNAIREDHKHEARRIAGGKQF